MKNILKKVLKYLIIYVSLAALFSISMIVTYSLPNNRIRKNVEESIDVFKEEGTCYIPFFKQGGALLDSHTDALILNIAMNKGMNESNIKNAMENSFFEDETGGGVSSLDNALSEEQNNHEYSRYWHGVQVVIRPLLVFFTYTEIRYIMMIGVFSLLAIVLALIGKQLGTKLAVAFALVISMMFIVVIPVSIQYTCIFVVTLLSMISVLLLYKYNKEKNIYAAFFIIGAFSTFFDLLTYPLITFGLPLVLVMLFENRKNTGILKQILKVIELGILWVSGYTLLFVTKWVFASIILRKDAVTLALDQILFRVNGNEKYPVSRWETIKINYEYFFIPVAKKIMMILTGIWAVMFALYRKKIKECKIAITLILIASIPYMWFFVFAGHSGIHAWFTNRIQAITAFALLSLYGETIDTGNIGKYIRKIRGEKNENSSINTML